MRGRMFGSCLLRDVWRTGRIYHGVFDQEGHSPDSGAAATVNSLRLCQFCEGGGVARAAVRKMARSIALAVLVVGVALVEYRMFEAREAARLFVYS